MKVKFEDCFVPAARISPEISRVLGHLRFISAVCGRGNLIFPGGRHCGCFGSVKAKSADISVSAPTRGSIAYKDLRKKKKFGSLKGPNFLSDRIEENSANYHGIFLKKAAPSPGRCQAFRHSASCDGFRYGGFFSRGPGSGRIPLASSPTGYFPFRRRSPRRF